MEAPPQAMWTRSKHRHAQSGCRAWNHGYSCSLRARCDGSIRIHTGCALHFGLGNIRDALANPHKYAINGRTHLLVEFSDVVIPPRPKTFWINSRAKGIVPVIGHPERNPILQRCSERLQAWISMGCVLQVTARSLSGHFGPMEQRVRLGSFGGGHGARDRERRTRCVPSPPGVSIRRGAESNTSWVSSRLRSC